MSRALNEADFDLSDSEYEDLTSHFQMADINFSKSDFQFEQLDEKFEPRIAIISTQTYGRNIGVKTKPNLREVILMDIQPMMHIF